MDKYTNMDDSCSPGGWNPPNYYNYPNLPDHKMNNPSNYGFNPYYSPGYRQRDYPNTQGPESNICRGPQNFFSRRGGWNKHNSPPISQNFKKPANGANPMAVNAQQYQEAPVKSILKKTCVLQPPGDEMSPIKMEVPEETQMNISEIEVPPNVPVVNDNGVMSEKSLLRTTIDGRVAKKKTGRDRKGRVPVHPKNALMCLNELRTGLPYVVEQEGSSQLGAAFRVAVEVDGQTYRGIGSTKNLAKQAAAEAALISFVKPPTLTDNESEQMEDQTPWSALASFAMYKLFNEWKQGRIGMNPGMIPPALVSGVTVPEANQINALAAVVDQYLTQPPKPSVLKVSETHVFNPSKVMPANAAQMHPVMLLNQVRPGVNYSSVLELVNGVPKASIMAIIDDKEFKGEGQNKKKAKLHLARQAVKDIFNIESTWDGVA